MGLTVALDIVDENIGFTFLRWFTSHKTYHNVFGKELVVDSGNVADRYGAENLSFIIGSVHFRDLVHLFILAAESFHGHTIHFL